MDKELLSCPICNAYIGSQPVSMRLERGETKTDTEVISWICPACNGGILWVRISMMIPARIPLELDK